MSEFKVKISNMKSTVQQQNNIIKQMKNLQNEIREIQNGLSFEIAQKERIRQRLRTAQNDVTKEYNGIYKATKALDNIANVYETTEAKLSEAEVTKGTIITDIGSVLPYISDSSSVGTLSGISTGISWSIDQIASILKSKTKKGETLFNAKNEKSNIWKEVSYSKNKKELEDSKITPFKLLNKKWNYDTSLFHTEKIIGDKDDTHVSSAFDILKFKSNAEIYGGLYYIDEKTGEKKLRAAIGAEAGFTLSGLTAEQKLQLGSEFLGAYLITEETIGRSGAKVFGTDIGVKGSVNFGVGAHAEFGIKDGKFSMDIRCIVGYWGQCKIRY